MKNILLKKISIRTKNLKRRQINDIVKLKNQHWKYSIKSQLDYFKKKNKLLDIHNLYYLSDVLIGYTALKKRIFYISYIKKNYLLFDTLIISKKFRGLKHSTSMMEFNNKIIRKSKMPSFLVCEDNLYKFYKKFFWKKINNNLVFLVDYRSNKNLMYYNCQLNKFKNKNKIKIFFNQ